MCIHKKWISYIRAGTGYSLILRMEANLNKLTKDQKESLSMGLAAGMKSLLHQFKNRHVKPVFKVLESKNKKMQTDAQGADCPHCGHYCTGKTVFCTPPVERAAD
jgi:hypothetical protein